MTRIVRGPRSRHGAVRFSIHRALAGIIRRVYARKPVIGLAGGIGSGKSYVASLFADAGCLVIRSDDLARSAYDDPAVRPAVEEIFGPDAYGPDGKVRSRVVAARIFSDAAAKSALEQVLHPWVDRRRRRLMDAAAGDPQVKAYVWDTPLLFETGLHGQCDAIVFVEVPRDVRLSRVRATRGWDDAELRRRENLQWALDKKRAFAEYVVDNTADAGPSSGNEDRLRGQVRDVLSLILATTSSDRAQ